MLPSKLVLLYLQVYPFPFIYLLLFFMFSLDEILILYLHYCRSEHTGFQGSGHHKASTYWWICIWVYHVICCPTGYRKSMFYRLTCSWYRYMFCFWFLYTMLGFKYFLFRIILERRSYAACTFPQTIFILVIYSWSIPRMSSGQPYRFGKELVRNPIMFNTSIAESFSFLYHVEIIITFYCRNRCIWGDVNASDPVDTGYTSYASR